MKPIIVNLLCGPLLCFSRAANAQDAGNVLLPEARVIVHVVDQDGVKMADTAVGVGGTVSPKANPETYKRGLTDGDGTLRAQLRSNGEIHISAEKTGFYRTEITPAYTYRGLPDSIDRAFKSGRWQPEELTLEVTLKRIINPIAMLARRVNIAIPSSHDPVGFDFFAGDYVVPHGRGKTVDMLFKTQITERSANDYDYELIVSFPHKEDGIVPFEPIPQFQGSVLRSPYNAPDTGLLPAWTVSRSRRAGGPEKSNSDPEKHAYFFRTRTLVDSSGRIISANYGKIYGDFMNFTYYLNPTPNDRNMEFDPKRNLFTNLKDSEKPTAP